MDKKQILTKMIKVAVFEDLDNFIEWLIHKEKSLKSVIEDKDDGEDFINSFINMWAVNLADQILKRPEMAGINLKQYEGVNIKTNKQGIYHIEFIKAVSKASELIKIDNSQLYNTLTNAYARQEFKIYNDNWPLVNLEGSKLSATAEIIPLDTQSYLTEEERSIWQKRISSYLDSMGALTALVFDFITARWLEEAKGQNDMIWVTADEFLEVRALEKHKSGSGRRGGYSEKLRQTVEEHINILRSTMLQVHERTVIKINAKGKRISEKEHGVRGPAIITDLEGGQINVKGNIEPYRWQIRPGNVFANVLIGAGSKTAWIAKEILRLDPYRESWEINLGRNLNWHWRIRRTAGDYLRPFKVPDLLNMAGCNNTSKYSETRERLEKALNRLQDKKIISSWQYEDGYIHSTRRGWFKSWLKTSITINPPMDLILLYSKVKIVKPKKTKTLNMVDKDKLLDAIEQEGLNILQASEQIGVDRSQLSKIVRGRIKPGKKSREKINNWLNTRAKTES